MRLIGACDQRYRRKKFDDKTYNHEVGHVRPALQSGGLETFVASGCGVAEEGGSCGFVAPLLSATPSEVIRYANSAVNRVFGFLRETGSSYVVNAEGRQLGRWGDRSIYPARLQSHGYPINLTSGRWVEAK